MSGIDKLIEALQIFGKYNKTNYPTSCEHDILMIMDIEENTMASTDKEKVCELGFHWNDEYSCWASYEFGSA